MSSFKCNDHVQIQDSYGSSFHTKLVYLATLISQLLYEELALF